MTGAFRSFTFKVNIVMCEFDPAILLLAGGFAQVVDAVFPLCLWFLPTGTFLQWLVLVVPFHV